MPLQPNIYYIQNQPNKIDTPSTACVLDDYDYRGIINADDVSKFQFQIYPRQYAAELAVNAEFTSNASWTIANIPSTSTPSFTWTSFLGGLYINATSNYFYISQNLVNAAVGAMIEAKINIIANTCGVQLYIGNEIKQIPANVTGELTYYSVITSLTNCVFGILYSGSTTFPAASFGMGYFRVKEVHLAYKFLLRRVSDDAVIYSYNLQSYINGTYPGGNSPFRRIDNFITYEHDWTGLDEDCYKIEICDGVLNTGTQNNLHNWQFLVDDLNPSSPYDSIGWTVDSGSITGVLGVAIVNTNGGQLTVDLGVSGVWYLQNSGNTINGATYNISVDAAAGSGSPTYTLKYGASGALTTQVLTNGADHTGTFVGNGNPVIIQFEGTNVGLVYNSISVTLSDENNFSGNYESNEFILTNSSCDTVEISACNDVDSFDFSFPLSNFSLNTRLLGAITNAQYEFERNTYTNIIGNNRTTYFQRQKIKVIKIKLVPEYVLDFLTLLGGMDHIYINDVEYSAKKNEFININYPDSLNTFATVELFLFEKDSTAINKITTALAPGCGAVQNYLLDPEDITDPNDDTQVIDPQTGDPIISL